MDMRVFYALWLLGIMLLWILAHRFVCRRGFSFLLPRYAGEECLGQMVTLMLNDLRNRQTVFQSSCPILSSHKQKMRVPTSPHLHQHLLLSVSFFTLAIPMDVKWCLTVSFIFTLIFWGRSRGTGEMTYSRSGHWRIGGTELPGVAAFGSCSFSGLASPVPPLIWWISW